MKIEECSVMNGWGPCRRVSPGFHCRVPTTRTGTVLEPADMDGCATQRLKSKDLRHFCHWILPWPAGKRHALCGPSLKNARGIIGLRMVCTIVSCELEGSVDDA